MKIIEERVEDEKWSRNNKEMKMKEENERRMKKQTELWKNNYVHGMKSDEGQNRKFNIIYINKLKHIINQQITL